jgi:hypothetical protein
MTASVRAQGELAALCLVLAACQFDGGGRLTPGQDGGGISLVDAASIGVDDASSIDRFDAGRINGPDASPPDASPPDAAPPDAEPAPSVCAPDPDLLACLPLDGEAVDLSTYQNGITADDLAFSAGVRGSALDVDDGVDVTLAETNTLDPTSGITLELWIRPGSFPTGSDRVGILDNNAQWGLFGREDGQVTCSMAPASLTLAGALVAGVWQHLACTYDGATIRLYRNGQQIDSVPADTELTTSGDDGTAIGRNNPTGEYFDGSIDEVRIWRRALAASELDGGRALF